MRRRADIAHQAAAGLLFFLAFLTKQTALAIAAPLCIYCLVVLEGRLKLVFPAVLAALVVASTLALDAWSGGWYTWYVFELPAQHEVRWPMLVDFWGFDLLGQLGPAFLTSLLFLVILAARRRRPDLVFHACLFAGMVGASWFSRLHWGGWFNTLMPGYAALAVLFALGIKELLELLAERPSALEGSRPAWLRLFVHLVCLAQLGSLVYSPVGQVPSKRDAEAGRTLVRVMGRFEGPVYLPHHGYLPTLAGKQAYGPGMATYDVLRSRDEERKAKLLGEIDSAIRNREFDAVITNERGVLEGWFLDALQESYVHKGNLYTEEDLFWPVAGHRMRPQGVWVRRE
jgi:hypothetical protein